MKRFAALTLLALSVAAPAFAQAGPRVVVHNMDEDLIEGVVLKAPDMPVTTTPPKHAHKNLIQVRKSFTTELLASASRI